MTGKDDSDVCICRKKGQPNPGCADRGHVAAAKARRGCWGPSEHRKKKSLRSDRRARLANPRSVTEGFEARGSVGVEAEGRSVKERQRGDEVQTEWLVWAVVIESAEPQESDCRVQTWQRIFRPLEEGRGGTT